MALNTQLAQAVLPKCSGIYAIKNSATGGLYIGSAVNMAKRCGDHQRMLSSKTHHSVKLQRSWDKHGADKFTFSALLQCEQKNLLFYEQLMIDGFESAISGYNMSPTAGSNYGVVPSAETRQKQSAAKIGKKLSDAHRLKLRNSLLGNKHRLGTKLSEKEKQRCRDHRHSDEARALISSASKGNTYNLGKEMPQSVRDKISAANRGRPHTPEHNAKVSAAQIGRVFTDEHRARMSAAKKGKPANPSAIAAMTASNIGRKMSAEAITQRQATRLANRILSNSTRY